MLMGTYERAGVPWSPHATPWDFGQDLLPNDLERIAPSLEVGFEHFPALGEAGIKKVVNGPFTFAPDGNPLDRPGQRAQELLGRLRRDGGIQPGRWRGTRAGALDGRRRPGRGCLGHGRCALRRLGDAGLHQRQGARELFAALPDPLSQRGADGGAAAAHDADLRPAAGENAVFGEYCGLEHPLWFAPTGVAAEEDITFQPLERARARRGRMQSGARCGRSAGDLQLRQVRDDRTRRGRVAVARDGESCARRRPHRSYADAE